MKIDNIFVLIKKANIEIDRLGNQKLAPYNLTHSQFKVLKFLSLHKGVPVRQIDIEQFFYMTNPTVTGLLQTLENKGLVERNVNPEDKRSKLIRSTDAADRLVESAQEVMDYLEDSITEGLTPEQKQQLRELLQIMVSKYGIY